MEPDAPWSLILGLSCPLIQVLGAVYSTYAIVWTHEWASYKINQHSQPLMALPCVIFGSVTFVTVFSAPAHLSPPWVADTPLRIVVVTLSSWLISSLFVLSFFSSSALHRPEAIAYAYAALWLAFIFFAKFWAPRAAVTLLIFFSSLISYITSAIRDCLSAPMTRQTISAVETTSLLYAEEVLDSPENAAAEPSSSSHIASGKCLLPLHVSSFLRLVCQYSEKGLPHSDIRRPFPTARLITRPALSSLSAAMSHAALWLPLLHMQRYVLFHDTCSLSCS